MRDGATRQGTRRAPYEKRGYAPTDLHVDDRARLEGEGDAELADGLAHEVVFLGVIALVDLGERLFGRTVQLEFDVENKGQSLLIYSST